MQWYQRDIEGSTRCARAIAIVGSPRLIHVGDPSRPHLVKLAMYVFARAVKRLSDGFRAEHPDIPWGRICGMRDRVVHAYDRVDLDIVWSVATSHARALISALDVLIPPE